MAFMMKWIFGGMILLSFIAGIFTGNIGGVSNAALEEGSLAVELLLYMLGGMCVWGGIMRIAEKSGLTRKLSICFRPVLKRLFKGMDMNGKAFDAVCMNITANLLGLGNAATPLGLEAMRRMEEEERSGAEASDNMILFTVLNTAPITLIPTTVASLRLKYGASEPMDILAGTLTTSLISVTVGLFLAKLLNKRRKKGSGR